MWWGCGKRTMLLRQFLCVSCLSIASFADADPIDDLGASRDALEQNTERLLAHLDTTTQHEAALVDAYPSLASVSRVETYLCIVRAFRRSRDLAVLAASVGAAFPREAVEGAVTAEVAPAFGSVPPGLLEKAVAYASADGAPADRRAAVWNAAWEALASLSDAPIAGAPGEEAFAPLRQAHAAYLDLQARACAKGDTTSEVLFWEGPVTKDTVWRGTVVVEGEVHIQRDVTLLVLPGTHVLFRPVPRPPKGTTTTEVSSPYTSLWVEGRLLAKGLPGHRILFGPLLDSERTPLLDQPLARRAKETGRDSAPPWKAWHGIWIYSRAEAPRTEFRYCHFRNLAPRHPKDNREGESLPKHVRWYRPPELSGDPGIDGGIRIHGSPALIERNWFDTSLWTAMSVSNAGPASADATRVLLEAPTIQDNLFWRWAGWSGALCVMNHHPISFQRNVLCGGRRTGRWCHFYHSGHRLTFSRNVFVSPAGCPEKVPAKAPRRGADSYPVFGLTGGPPERVSANVFVGFSWCDYPWYSEKKARARNKDVLETPRVFSGNLFEKFALYPWQDAKAPPSVQKKCDGVLAEQNTFGRAIFVAENTESPWLADWRLAEGSPGTEGAKVLVGISEVAARPNARPK